MAYPSSYKAKLWHVLVALEVNLHVVLELKFRLERGAMQVDSHCERHVTTNVLKVSVDHERVIDKGKLTHYPRREGF